MHSLPEYRPACVRSRLTAPHRRTLHLFLCRTLRRFLLRITLPGSLLFHQPRPQHTLCRTRQSIALFPYARPFRAFLCFQLFHIHPVVRGDNRVIYSPSESVRENHWSRIAICRDS